MVGAAMVEVAEEAAEAMEAEAMVAEATDRAFLELPMCSPSCLHCITMKNKFLILLAILIIGKIR